MRTDAYQKSFSLLGQRCGHKTDSILTISNSVLKWNVLGKEQYIINKTNNNVTNVKVQNNCFVSGEEFLWLW